MPKMRVCLTHRKTAKPNLIRGDIKKIAEACLKKPCTVSNVLNMRDNDPEIIALILEVANRNYVEKQKRKAKLLSKLK